MNALKVEFKGENPFEKFTIELFPEAISELVLESPSPINADKYGFGAYMVASSTVEDSDVVVQVDGSTITTENELSLIPINDELIESVPEGAKSYFQSKIGCYVVVVMGAWDTTLSEGTHSMSITVKGVDIYYEFTVEPEPVVVMMMQQGIEDRINNMPRPSIQLYEEEGKVLIDAVVKLNYDFDNATIKFVVFCEAQQKVKREIPVKSYGEVTEQNVASLNSQYIFVTPLQVGDYYAVLTYETPLQDDDFNWMEWYQWLADRAATIWFEDSEHSVQSDELPLNFLQ